MITKHEDEISVEQLAKMKAVLESMGMDCSKEDTIRTPLRFLATIRFFQEGYEQEVLLKRTYGHSCSLMLEQDVPFVSACQHHLMPFHGNCTIAYIPQDQVTGLSKLDELVYKHAHRFQIQEQMGEDIADELNEALPCAGIAVLIKAVHTCKLVEGFQPTYYKTATLRGVFKDESSTRMELYQLLRW